MCRCHDKRPKSQIAKTHLHAYPIGMARPKKTIQSECKQNGRSGIFQGRMRQANSSQENYGDDNPNGKSMAQCDRQQRTKYRCAFLFLQPERNSEKPSHGWVQAVKKTQRKYHQPGTEVAHGKQYESLDESPPSRRI